MYFKNFGFQFKFSLKFGSFEGLKFDQIYKILQSYMKNVDSKYLIATQFMFKI